jgi:branched-chain amino acid transport system ATP-binding protein
MIRVDDVSRHFGGLKAVDHVSLEIAEGSITGLIGPNGAGKTTLFNTIAGLYAPIPG